MPTVAEKLCHDVVDLALKSSNYNNVTSKQTKRNIKTPSSFSGNPTRSVYVEKKREVSKIAPAEKKSIVKILKSKETILKKHFIDIAVNTLISGPLRCDNYCVTMVQRRDHSQHVCKCSKQKVKPKASSKIVQTLFRNSLIHMDKACANCIDKVNCGTQILDKQNSILKSSAKKSSKSKSNINFIIPKDSFEFDYSSRRPSVYSNVNQHGVKRYSEASYHNITTHCLGGKQWALSNYPKRGPDF